MRRHLRTLRYSTFAHGIGGLLVALACTVALSGCDETTKTPTPVESTVGSLNINVHPASATVVVAGPASYTQTFNGNQFLANLAPGQYSAAASAPGFNNATGQINVVAGLTSSISIDLAPKTIIEEAPRAVYRDGSGNLIPIGLTDMQSGRFAFYAWVLDLPAGIHASELTSPIDSDPGKPLIAEQIEFAPSFTQNLAAAWIGFTDPTGAVRPVIGGDVRWEIDQWWTGRVNSMQFGTSDDNRMALGYGVFDDQADTRTNNARLSTEPFPLIATEYPLYNQTGVGTPFVDGFTWVTLFSPDAMAAGRIVAVATINGIEIGKQVLYKQFAPTPELEITKTVDHDLVNLVGGTATVTWTVTVTNVGIGDATNIDLNDILATGVGANYTLGSLPEGSVAVGDGFTLSFPLDSLWTVFSPTYPGEGNTMTLTFTATVTEAGTYCNESQIVAFSNENHTWTPIDLKAQACFTAIEPNVSIIKDFVAADDTTSLGKSLTVSADEPARLRVRVVNSGTGAAMGVLINDELTSGSAAPYRVIEVTPGTPNGNDGFDTNVGTLAAGATATVLFTVAASTDGVYCDTATVTAAVGTNIGIDHDSACLTVATPHLEITKSDAPESVLPGASYISTIVVNNTGNATAHDVVISDAIGLNAEANVRAIYVSSSLNGTAGMLAGNIVTSMAVDIPAGESVTFTVVSRIPLGAISGTYCDTATVVSINADSPLPVSDCVQVPAFSALQTQLIDLADPIAAGSEATFFSVLYVEELSNEGVGSNEMLYSFGLVSPTGIGTPGLFREVSTHVYLDTDPIRDPSTGLVISDLSNPTALLLAAGTDYTVDNSTAGLQRIVMTPSFVLQRDQAIYVVHVLLIPAGTPGNRMYTTSYIWDSVGLVNPSNNYEASSSEPTTVLP